MVKNIKEVMVDNIFECYLFIYFFVFAKRRKRKESTRHSVGEFKYEWL